MENEITGKIREAEFVLVGIGEEFGAVQGEDTQEKNDSILAAYNRLAELLKGKAYFVVTQNEDSLIFESKLIDFFIAAPFADEKRMQSSEEQWNAYLNWLTATLGHSLCILELGVGFAAPQVIRWPFEKTAQYNLKSRMIRVNEKFPQLPKELAERGSSVHGNSVMRINEITLEDNK